MSNDRLKFICGHVIGFVVIIGLLVAIGKIAIGHVEEATSYGLMPLIVALSNLAVLYGNWAWQKSGEVKKGETNDSV